MYRFLNKVWNLQNKLETQNSKLKTQNSKLLHKTIKKVTEDIEAFRFNTAVSALMILVNEFEKQKQLSVNDYQTALKLLSPMAPHISEELWSSFARTSEDKRYENSIFLEKWPRYDPQLIKEEIITLIIQVNGKVRGKIKTEADVSAKKAEVLAISSKKVQKWIEGKEIKKVIFVPGKLINIVV